MPTTRSLDRDKMTPSEEKRVQNRNRGTLEIWISETYRLLHQEGVSCDLVNELPKEGVVILYNNDKADFLSNPKTSLKNLFIVNVVADLPPHPSAQLHIVQNKTHTKRLPASYFIPHWPQPDLLARDPNRGNRFENIHFFGYSKNLDSYLHSEEWKNRLRRETGLFLDIKDPDHWHDYRDTDCTIAIRDFSRSRHIHKPATKLYNAWLTGVPFIGGRDSAYAADGHPGKDYLVATSPDEILAQLQRLKKDETFRANLVHQGTIAGNAFSRTAILERWKYFLQEALPVLVLQWQQQSPTKRYCSSMIQHTCCFADRYMR